MDDNLTDQQRADQVRGWIGANGGYLAAGLVLGVAALFGWRQWNSYHDSHGEQASALYEEMLTAARVGRTVRAEELAAEIARDYDDTPYVDQARLAMARAKMDASQPEAAAEYLNQVVRESKSPAIASIARLRLGRVLVQQEKYDEALKVLAVPQESAFAARFNEVRGDVYYAMGRNDEARTEYEAALRGAEEGGVDPAYLRAKLDEVGGPASAATAAAVQAPAAE